MILMWRPAGPSVSRILAMSDALRTKEAAIMSTLYRTPKSTMSDVSFSVIVGRSTITPGRFMFFFSPILTLLHTRTTTDAARSSLTVHMSVPSAMRMLLPTATDVGSVLYEHAMRVVSPSTV